MKRFISLVVTVIMVVSLLVPMNSLAQTDLTITATPAAGENYIRLEWTDLGPGYLYTVYAKGQDEAVYQSIPSKTDVKVLNVYPDAGNELKTWMETNGYGKGLITVDQVNMLDFNVDPGSYLKDDGGNWKYDVIYFGGYDKNNDFDISEQARDLVEQFIKTGRGVLFGHDTILEHDYNHVFKSLSSYINIELIGDIYYGNTTVSVKKEGLLTNYPWVIGGKGTVLNIPMSHTVGQFAMGDVWLEYTSDSYTNNENPVTEWSGKAGTTNFYLTTWNNCAMIQTGHSNGAATEDEQKLLANTLFYLAQLTGNNFCDDHKSQDFAAPDSVNISSVKVDGNSLVVNYSKSDDNGTEYEFYVKAINEYIGDEIISNTATAINTTGLAGYSYIIDNNQDTEPDNKVDTTDTSISVHLSELDLTIPVYIHIKAVDNAGNSSDTTHYEYTIKDKLEVKPKSVTLNKGSSKQLEAVLTSFSYEIQDVRWESSDEKVATVDSNGKVTAVGIGKCTIKAYITETDIMADCEVSVLKRPSGGSDSPNTTPKEVTVTEPPTTPVPAALPVDIAISLTSDKTTYTEHEEIIFTINYKNMLKSDTGPFEIIADILDNTTAVDSGAGEIKESTISWKIQNLAAEGSGKIVYKVKSGEISVDEVMISNTARISGNEGLINTDDDKSTVKVMLRKQKKLSHKAYVVGYPDGEFKPERHVTRAEVAVMFAKIMGLAPIKSEKKIYSDVETTHWASDYIQSATNAGIFIGYKDNSFHPDDPITRAEFATVVAKYMQVENVKPFEEVYKDLSGHWAQNYIEEIKRLKIIEGYEDGTFRPDLPIKRSEAVTMINKMLFRGPLKVDIASFEDVPPTSWFFGQVEEAARDHEYYTENGYEVLAD